MSWWEWIIVIGLWLWTNIDQYRCGETLAGDFNANSRRNADRLYALETELGELKRKFGVR